MRFKDIIESVVVRTAAMALVEYGPDSGEDVDSVVDMNDNNFLDSGYTFDEKENKIFSKVKSF